MKSQMMFGEKEVWIKTNGDVEIRTENGVTVHHINCDYRIDDAREQLMDGIYKSAEDVVQRLDMANSIDALVDECCRFLPFGAYKSVLFYFSSTDRPVFLRFNRNGLDTSSCGMDIIDYTQDNITHYEFDQNSLMKILQLLTDAASDKAGKEDVLTVIKDTSTEVVVGEIPELFKLKA